MIKLTFVNIDSCNRPVFKDNMKNYYGSVNKLFPYEITGEEVLKSVFPIDITYFGNKFDHEPMGSNIDTNDIRLGVI